MKTELAKHAARYVKVIEWSKEDDCFVGSAPPLIGHCCHGRTEAAVMSQLCVIVADLIKTIREHGEPLPAATAGKKYSGKFLVRLTPSLHKKLVLKAMARGDSLNEFVAGALAKA